MSKTLSPLFAVVVLLILVSCSKKPVVPTVATAVIDTVTTKVPVTPVTPVLPAGVHTTFSGTATAWLAAMHTTTVSLGAENYETNTIATDNKGNIYALFYYDGQVDVDPGTGVVLTSSAVGRRPVLAKYNAAGNLIWSTQFNSDGDIAPLKVRVDQSGNVYCSLECIQATYLTFGQNNYTLKQPTTAGAILQYNTSGIVLKFNTSGVKLWLSEIAYQNTSSALGGFDLGDIDIDLSGNVYAAGTVAASLLIYGNTLTTLNCPNPVNLYYYLIKYDSNGNVLSSKILLQAIRNTNSRAMLAVDVNQNVYMVGGAYVLVTGTTLIGNSTSGGSSINKYDKNGNWIWFKGGGYNIYSVLKTDASGNMYAVGTSNAFQSDVVWKIGSNGVDIWQQTISTSLPQSPKSLSIDNSGDILVAGDYDVDLPDRLNFNHAIYLNKYSSSGSLIYNKKLTGYQSFDYQSAYSAAFDNLGSVDMIGFFEGSFKFFGTSNDPVGPWTDFTLSFFISHFPDN